MGQKVQYNRTRELLAQLEEIRKNKNSSLSGVDALAIILSAAAMPREKYNSILETTLEDLCKNEPLAENKKRLMLVGSANDDIELVRLIEGESVHVVADNLCFGPRQYENMVDENESPLKALAGRYLASSECPRMFGEYKLRLKILENKIQEYSIDCVVLQNIRFCDRHGSENGLFEQALEKQGIPSLRLEREYGPLVESGRVKMRVDAFMERLG
jgi:benzoyl-CoA reductase subunit C